MLSMRPKKQWVLWVVVVSVWFAPLAAAQTSTRTDTLFLRFGIGVEEDQRWDGSVDVLGGEVVLVEGWQFSKDDSVTGPKSWRLTNRRDEVAGFARINYTEMSPAQRPRVLHFPVGVFVTIRHSGGATVSVQTTQGSFAFSLSDVGLDPSSFLGGRASVAWSPTVEKLTTDEYEDDEAAITRLPDGSLVTAWVAYRDRGDHVMIRTGQAGRWSVPEEVTPEPADLFRCSLAVDAQGGLWVFWSRRDGTSWQIWGRRKHNGSWQAPVKLSGDGTNTFHRASASKDGHVFVVWQSFRGDPGQAQSDVYLRSFAGGAWSDEMRVSESMANDWEPQVAGGANGSAFVVWDSYHRGNYDIFFRSFESGKLGSLQQVTSSTRFQAHASVAVDAEGRPWLAWDESGANWGKDQGFLINPPMSAPLHQERSIRVAMWDGKAWREPKRKIEPFYVYRLHPNFENPQIIFDGRGALNMVFRHWTRQRARAIGSKLGWENYLTRYDGDSWTQPIPLAHSRGSIEKRPALTIDNAGSVWAAWMTDNRPFEDMIPRNAEIYAANLGRSRLPPRFDSGALGDFEDPFAEEAPIHPTEKEDLAKIRAYTIESGDAKYKIYRGDMHRHTDVSQDFKYDGSLIEVYRYALDAAGLDYIVPTDHQLGFDHEFTWWQDEKLTDLFHIAGTFTPLFGYERSLPFPNGHRNVIFAKRGTRTLPIPDDERSGEAGAAKLYEYLRQNDGISMPHSSGTAQGTDFRDNDPAVEPLIEIYQGYRASYEYKGAPKAASDEKLITQRSGYNPNGYWWNALAKGLKLGVQASSDHWSTHISYACILSPEFTREAMFDAIKKRHVYAATDNIILDFQAEAAGKSYIMGDIIPSNEVPKLKIRAIGTDKIKQLVIVKNQTFVYTGRPNSKEVYLEFQDRNFEPGANYYYVRVLQNNEQIAWSSPIWVE